MSRPEPRDLAAKFSAGWSAAAMAPDNYGRDNRNAPVVPEGDAVLFAEPGRVLRVRHGAGEESLTLRYDGSTERALAALDSDARYLLMHQLHEAHRDGRKREAARWRRAAADKRIKVRKVRGQAAVRVSIDPARVTTTNEGEAA